MADEKDNVGEGAGGGRKKLIILVAVAVLLLLGAGAAAYILVGGEDEPAEGAAVQEETPAVEEGEPEYLTLDPAFIVNLPPGGPAGMLQVSIDVMARDPAVIATLKANEPLIRHHLLNLLESQQSADLLTRKGKETLQVSIHELLNTQLKDLGEAGEIKGVFFTQFVMQ